jgi:hypothetical protein
VKQKTNKSLSPDKKLDKQHSIITVERLSTPKSPEKKPGRLSNQDEDEESVYTLDSERFTGTKTRKSLLDMDKKLAYRKQTSLPTRTE